ncbi:MAG: T9SS type A sorting domain-containing protein [Bacteroidota bacterium]|nr:T9SS type A sorting domain-containing protein [Bacteroidota bacterium]
MRKFVFACFIILFSIITKAQNITWATDIACIIYSHCGTCHNSENSISQISLMSYQEVFNRRLAVELYTYTGKMPPSLPDNKYSHIAGNKRLNENEIALIREWAFNDALRGDSTLEPAPPVITASACKLTTPDISIKIPDFIVPDSANHFRKCFVLTSPFTSVKNIKAIEVIPGNVAAVHAVYLYADTSDTSVILDAGEPGNGYTHFFGTGSNSAKPLYGWVPGSKILSFPEGLSLKIDRGSRIIVQLEYAEKAGGLLDSTRINIKFDEDTSSRQADVLALLSHQQNLLNGPFVIPIDSIRIFKERYQINQNLTLLGLTPNLHHFCTEMKVFAVRPGNDTIGLLHIADWDPVWTEGTYYFQKPVHLPAGSWLYAIASFNNTANNLHEPDDTLSVIYGGTGIKDEEMIFNFTCLPYLANDEAIILDTSSHLKHHLDCKPLHVITQVKNVIADTVNMDVYPNPGKDVLNIVITSKNIFTPYQLQIISLQGSEILNQQIDSPKFELNISAYQNGLYFIRIFYEDHLITRKIIFE